MSEGLPQCQPVLLEPIYKVEIVCPSEATAKMNALMSGRRGQILGFDTREGWDGWDIVRVQMPEAEIGDLIIEVRSATAGVGSFTFKFDHMAELTGRIADQIIAARKAAAGGVTTRGLDSYGDRPGPCPGLIVAQRSYLSQSMRGFDAGLNAYRRDFAVVISYHESLRADAAGDAEFNAEILAQDVCAKERRGRRAGRRQGDARRCSVPRLVRAVVSAEDRAQDHAALRRRGAGARAASAARRAAARRVPARRQREPTCWR